MFEFQHFILRFHKISLLCRYHWKRGYGVKERVTLRITWMLHICIPQWLSLPIQHILAFVFPGNITKAKICWLGDDNHYKFTPRVGKKLDTAVSILAALTHDCWIINYFWNCHVDKSNILYLKIQYFPSQVFVIWVFIFLCWKFQHFWK
jgi:hypothetical protein